MALQLTEAVPWGRLTSEYIRMFALTPQDLNRRILDCGGGPSSFAAEMTAEGKQVVSCDPLYRFTGEHIRQRIDEIYPRMTALTEAGKDNFVWHEYGSPAQLLSVAKEVRVFPLLTAFSGEISPYLSPVMEQLRSLGYVVEVQSVEYEFQKGGNKMLRVEGSSRPDSGIISLAGGED